MGTANGSRAEYHRNRRKAKSGGDPERVVIEVPANVLADWKTAAREMKISLEQYILVGGAEWYAVGLSIDGDPNQEWTDCQRGQCSDDELRRTLAMPTLPELVGWLEPGASEPTAQGANR